jgi:hypothetical protein
LIGFRNPTDLKSLTPLNKPALTMAPEKDPKYPLGAIKSEAERLHKQHLWVQACLDNQIVFAPVDLKKPGLKILDVGCADGRSWRYHALP